MRNLILVVLIFQLVLILTEAQEYRFGDIISFERSCCFWPAYKHYAVYVGDEPFDGKEAGQNIFHRTGLIPLGKCQFGRLEEQGGVIEVDRMLDGDFQQEINDPDHHKRVRERILHWLNNCGDYKVFTNNCAHLATDVRYGKTFFRQDGTAAKRFCNRNRSKRGASCPKFDKIVEKMEKNAKLESDCLSNPKCPVKAG